MRVFRELFSDQVLAPGALVSVASMTLVSTMPDDAAALLRSMGDAEGYALILEHIRVIDEVMGRYGGALLKSVGSRTVSAFESAASAVEAVFALRAALSERPALSKLRLRVGVHRGTMVAATIGDRLDYFGRHAEAAFALPAELESANTLLSQSVVDDEAVRELLRARTKDRAPRRLRGFGPDAWGVEFR
jgi:class 3 adenylate cyclase